MGNIIASQACDWVTIMKLDGETIRLKAPVSVEQVVRDYPDNVVLDSDAVRHIGTKAKPLDSSTQLKPNHVYFFGMAKIEDQRAPNRVRSDISMSAKSRLEVMMLARRSSSDITIPKSVAECSSSSHSGEAEGSTRVKVRMTKAQLTQLMAESRDSSETAKKILEFSLHDGEAQKNVRDTQNIAEKSPTENISDACKKGL